MGRLGHEGDAVASHLLAVVVVAVSVSAPVATIPGSSVATTVGTVTTSSVTATVGTVSTSSIATTVGTVTTSSVTTTVGTVSTSSVATAVGTVATLVALTTLGTTSSTARGLSTGSTGSGGGLAVDAEDRVDGEDTLVVGGGGLLVGGDVGGEVLDVLGDLGLDGLQALGSLDVLGGVLVGRRVGLLDGEAAAEGAVGGRVAAANGADVTGGGFGGVSACSRYYQRRICNRLTSDTSHVGGHLDLEVDIAVVGGGFGHSQVDLADGTGSVALEVHIADVGALAISVDGADRNVDVGSLGDLGDGIGLQGDLGVLANIHVTGQESSATLVHHIVHDLLLPDDVGIGLGEVD